jgi:hypothetical protein
MGRSATVTRSEPSNVTSDNQDYRKSDPDTASDNPPLSSPYAHIVAGTARPCHPAQGQAPGVVSGMMAGMSSLEDLEQRVAAMEAELAIVRQEAAAARALAAGADRDVADYRSELRAHTRTLGALRETQLEHYTEHKTDAAEIKAGIAQIVRLLEGLGDSPS